MDTKSKLNQRMKIIEYMRNNNGITSLEAVENLRILRLASRIHELVKLGYDIDKETIYKHKEDGSVIHYTKYTLLGEPA